MDKKLLIDVKQARTKVALVEDGELVEFHIEKESSYNIVGNIYKGKVVNLLAGMQAAFVDIGLDKNAFLYVGDMLVDKSELIGEQLSLPSELSVKENDIVMVQVIKDRIGTKGARVSYSITLPGRFLVLMPSVNYIGVSKKITDEKAREKLFSKVKKLKPEGMGFIVRTAAAKASPKELKAEADYLINHWQEIQDNYKKSDVSDVLHYESDLISRTFRDMFTDDINDIVINDINALNRITRQINNILPKCKRNIINFSNNKDMFFEYRISEQVDNMLKHKVWMHSGAYLIIDKTEALTVIDVNTGKYVGDQNLEETVYNTNILAAKEIAKQIRLRNIGGIIICDFIDMEIEEHKDCVLECLETALKKDRVKSTVIGMSGLGLVEITRKKTRNEISTTLLQCCPYCSGDGYVFSYDHIMNKIGIALINSLDKANVKGVLVSLNPAIIDYIFRNRIFSDYLADKSNYRIYLSSEYNMHIEKFKIREFVTNEFDLPQNARYLSY